MSAIELAIAAITAALAAASLAGLIARGRSRVCVSFTAYLLSAVVIHALIIALPRLFWTWAVWAISDFLQTALRVAIAVEIALKTFRPLPEGRRRFKRVLLVLALGVVLGVALSFTPPRNAAEWTLVAARVSYGVAFFFAALVVFAGHYYVPLDPLHREIALGFVVLSLLVAFAHALSALDSLVGLGHYSVSKVAYPLILLGWVWSAWRREPPTGLSPETLRRLRPWRRA